MMKEKMARSFLRKNIKFFLGSIFALVFWGLVMITDVSLIQGESTFGDRFYFLKHQLLGVGIGIFLMLIISRLNYHFLSKFSGVFYFFSIFLLVLVLIPNFGIRVYGASRWINLGFFVIQPSEITKLSILILFSKMYSLKPKPPLLLMVIFLLLPFTLIIFQPDFGSGIIVMTLGLMLIFLNEAKLTRFIFLGLLASILSIVLIFSSPYRRERVLGLINPFYDPQGKSYHVYQLALTLGSGGWFGTGMGNSRQKYQYLPEVTTDSIIAVLAEEFGFIGISIFIIFFLFIIFIGIRLVFGISDLFGKFLIAGTIFWIGIQGLVNLGAISMILPLTGVPFPFISYGSSSLVVLFIALGICLSVLKKEK